MNYFFIPFILRSKPMIECDTVWQYILTIIGGCMAIIAFAKLVSTMYSWLVSGTDRLGFINGMVTGILMAAVGMQKNIADGVPHNKIIIFTALAALTIISWVVFAMLKMQEYKACKQHEAQTDR